MFLLKVYHNMTAKQSTPHLVPLLAELMRTRNYR